MLLYFMNHMRTLGPLDVVYLLFGYAVLILLILPVHEFAHALAAHLCGDDTARWNGRLTLNPFRHLDVWGTVMMLTVGIGYAKPVPVNSYNFRNRKRDMILVALAGPISNFLMAFLSVGLFRVGFTLIETQFMAGSLPYAQAQELVDVLSLILVQTIASVNISLMVFNLLPIPPLDGSRLWSSLLPPRWAYLLESNSRYITMGLFVVLMTGLLDRPLVVLQQAVLSLIYTVFGLN